MDATRSIADGAGQARTADPAKCCSDIGWSSQTKSRTIAAGSIAEWTCRAPDTVSQSSSGGDFVVDVFKALHIDYLAMIPAREHFGK